MMLDNHKGVRIGSMDLPGRKKPCLVIYDENKNMVTKYASFNNDYAAVRFMELLAEFVGAKEE